jgi:hypothetical protein
MKIINGWEYFTSTYPDVENNKLQTLQNDYLKEYNLAYHQFVQSLCIPNIENVKDDLEITKYKSIIDCEGDSDVINNNNDYPIKFLKSKFIRNKSKKLKIDLITYYKPLGFYVKGPFEIFKDRNKSTNRFCIELCW